jgi:uncharacterized protein YigE (DUF2233 family)
MRWVIALFGISLALSAPATAQEGVVDLWSEPNPGVRYLRRTTDLPCTIHALVVDLAADGVAIAATPHGDRWQPVGTWAHEGGMVAAINGGFWGSFARPDGVAVGGGELWPDVADDADYGFFAVDARGRATISAPEEIVDVFPDDLESAVSGRPLLVRDGAVDSVGLDAFEHSRNRHPRTAVGVSRDGRTVYLVVADGRRAHSRGQNLYELSALMVELGAFAALNLDGGGSSTMYVERLGGIVNAPSGGRWEVALGLTPGDEVARERVAEDGLEEAYVRGVEREVMNHLGVAAPRWDHDLELARAGLDALPRPDPVDAPAPPLFRIGTMRELLYPAFWAVGFGAPLLLILLLLRKRGLAFIRRARPTRMGCPPRSGPGPSVRR